LADTVLPPTSVVHIPALKADRPISSPPPTAGAPRFAGATEAEQRVSAAGSRGTGAPSHPHARSRFLPKALRSTCILFSARPHYYPITGVFRQSQVTQVSNYPPPSTLQVSAKFSYRGAAATASSAFYASGRTGMRWKRNLQPVATVLFLTFLHVFNSSGKLTNLYRHSD
jgi:hypothetical protein